MVNRNQLRRQRQGHTTDFGRTPPARQILPDGRRRIRETGAVHADSDGSRGPSPPDGRGPDGNLPL
ncbi:MAG: hypothetical protein JF597_16190 [Streptomyces sp.]|nr:hypothetical protein [Streptomyces sp.]